MTPSVLVVVPVYGDLDSLLRCVDALVTHVDTTVNRVLLVNDCGPDADAIERALIERIDGLPGFRYERNDHNLGFVGTCNRAVLELDTGADAVLLLNSDAEPTEGFLEAMTDVLFADDTTGVVTARSDNATIASIPYRLTDRRAPRTAARTHAVWSELMPFLPVSQEVPVAMGFCFMTRRELVAQHGLFDEAFAPGYGEENDYCLRIAADGWTSRIANRALVFHEGSKSFAGDRSRLRADHQRELERRYPLLPDAVAAYQRLGTTAAERFADCLVPSGAPLRVSVDLRHSVDPAGLLEATRAAFAGPRYSVEAMLPGDHGNTDAPHPDDLVTVSILVDPSASDIITANRRALLIGLVVEDVDTGSWSSRARRTGSAVLPTDLYALGSVVPNELRTLEKRVAESLAQPVDRRTGLVSDRWRALLLADIGAFSAEDGSDDRIRQLRSELAMIKQSRSYSLARRLSTVAKRLTPRRSR